VNTVAGRAVAGGKAAAASSVAGDGARARSRSGRA
jgi:hypothetical protein